MRISTQKWGFVVVRTAYADDEATDAAQWSTAFASLQEYALPSENDERMRPETFALAVIADPTLKGASYDTVRTAFNTWKNQEGREWESDVRRDCCLVVDGPALASLLQAPDKQPTSGPWVVAVHAEDPATVPYNGGGPHLGWMRVSARAMGELFGDIEAMSFVEVCPVRVYDGQIPLYDGIPCEGLVDPVGGIEGRYKFPGGTPRGVQAGNAMLADIERALGSQAVHKQPALEEE
jgi:hypothetical protein